MHMPTKKICMVLFLGGLISCGNPTDKNSSKSQVTTSGNTNEKVDLDGDVEIEEVAEVFFSKKQISGITYTAQLLSGNEFYSATNPTNSSKENKKLNAESVVILEFSMEKSRKKIWDQQTLRMDKTQAEQYLMGMYQKISVIKLEDNPTFRVVSIMKLGLEVHLRFDCMSF